MLHLYQQGFDQISVEPVTSEASASYALTERELPAIFSEYERLAEIILEHDKQGKQSIAFLPVLKSICIRLPVP